METIGCMVIVTLIKKPARFSRTLFFIFNSLCSVLSKWIEFGQIFVLVFIYRFGNFSWIDCQEAWVRQRFLVTLNAFSGWFWPKKSRHGVSVAAFAFGLVGRVMPFNTARIYTPFGNRAIAASQALMGGIQPRPEAEGLKQPILLVFYSSEFCWSAHRRQR